MSAYPSATVLPFNTQTVDDFSDPIVDDGGDGFARVRWLHDDRRKFNLVHPVLKPAAVDALDAHYAANRTGTFAFTWTDGNTYTVAYTRRPRYTPHLGGLKTAVVQLAESV